MAVDNKLSVVSQFLEEHLASVPSFEVNETTVKRLFQLHQLHQKQDKKLKLIIADMKQRSLEFQQEAGRLSKITDSLGLSSQNFSKSGKASLTALVSSAQALDAGDASVSSLVIEMSDRCDAHYRLRKDKLATTRGASLLNMKIKIAVEQRERWQRALQQLEENSQQKEKDLQEQSTLAVYLKSRGGDYRQRIQELEQKLASVEIEVEPSIYHSTLVKKAEDLQKLKDQLQPLRAKLDSYHELPPDLSLAKVKVEELKAELKSLENQLDRHISLMDL